MFMSPLAPRILGLLEDAGSIFGELRVYKNVPETVVIGLLVYRVYVRRTPHPVIVVE